jgi:hypothetical protein
VKVHESTLPQQSVVLEAIVTVASGIGFPRLSWTVPKSMMGWGQPQETELTVVVKTTTVSSIKPISETNLPVLSSLTFTI